MKRYNILHKEPAGKARNMKKKTIITITAAGIIMASAGGILWNYGRNSNDAASVYVQKVSDLMGGTVSINRFSGVTEVQDSINIDKDSGRKVQQIFVSEGQSIRKDDPLFVYDTSEAENQISAAHLDIEGLNNENSALNEEIADLSKMREQSSDDERFQYTAEIQAKQMQIRQNGYSIQAKQNDIARYQQEIDQATVLASIDGVIRTVNENTESSYGQETHFIQIAQTGEFRIRGTLDEQSIGMITAGMNVIIRSRTDESETWTGTVAKVENEPQTSSNDMYSSAGDTASRYPFYVSMNTSEGLLLGQHVFIEPDFGQLSAKKGIWIDQSFVSWSEDGEPYVYKSENGRLKKAFVEIGSTDENDFTTEIVSGLQEDDLIAWPDDTLKEGMKTTVSSSAGEIEE